MLASTYAISWLLLLRLQAWVAAQRQELQSKAAELAAGKQAREAADAAVQRLEAAKAALAHADAGGRASARFLDDPPATVGHSSQT